MKLLKGKRLKSVVSDGVQPVLPVYSPRMGQRQFGPVEKGSWKVAAPAVL